MSISPAQYFLYLQYMLAGIAMTVVFGAVYLRITPAEELRLIKNGNLACALSFGGALVGFCVTLAASIAHSVGFTDFIYGAWVRRWCRFWCILPPPASSRGRTRN